VVTAADVVSLQNQVDHVRADESVLDYLMALVETTRRSPLLRLGVSPRGSLALLRAARARALADGREFLVPDDLTALAVPALAHRVLLRAASGGETGAESVISALADSVPVPR
jgi:MoxR-like ATPase